MSTKGNPGRFDGMERAQPGEPVFTLRAHDPLAARMVKVWVWQRRKQVRKDFADGLINEEKRDLELIQCRDAEDIAFNMDEWREGEHGQQLAVESPDPGEEASKSYSGIVRSDEDLEAERLWQARKEFGRICQNAIAGITDAGEKLSEWGFAGTISRALNGLDNIRDAAKRATPEKGYSVADLEKEWD